MREKYGWIDGLKGISILMVIVLHTNGEVLPSYLGDIAHHGGNGVQMFFIISAFLAYKSLDYYFKDRDYNLKNILIWIGKKFLRLFVIYYIACACSILLVGGVPFWYANGENYLNVYNIIAHMTFTHDIFPIYCNSFIGVEWYLGALMIFYILSLLFYKVNNKLWKSIIWFVIIYALSEFLRIYQIDNLPPGNATHVYYAYATTFSFMTQIPVWMLGIVVYHIIGLLDKNKPEDGSNSVGRVIAGILLFLIGFALTIYQSVTQIDFMNDHVVILFGLWFAIICIGASLCKNYIIDNVVFNYIGKNSYGVYLLHPILFRLYSGFNLYIYNDYVNWIVGFLTVTIVSLILSVVLTRFIDNPIQKLFKKVKKA